MRHWTTEERALQSMLIKQQKPWRHSTGPKSSMGKNISKMNAYKNGAHNQSMKQILLFFKKCRNTLTQLEG